ncbi:hypothetical protein M0R45_023965 [Rubus argutus]|uniref:Uncharacterized protein n=1 Tax=Rubus argutus TaxID=59490 RepID=A0AAW1WQ48_RUBAR
MAITKVLVFTVLTVLTIAVAISDPPFRHRLLPATGNCPFSGRSTCLSLLRLPLRLVSWSATAQNTTICRQSLCWRGHGDLPDLWITICLFSCSVHIADLPESEEPRVPLEEPGAAQPAAAEMVAESDPPAAPQTRLATLLDVHVRYVNNRIDYVRRLTQAAKHYYMVMETIGSPLVFAYVILRIVRPAFVTFNWAHP